MGQSWTLYKKISSLQHFTVTSITNSLHGAGLTTSIKEQAKISMIVLTTDEQEDIFHRHDS